jgi:hypothetical protein
MPIAKIQLPDGRIAKFDVPEGTTPEQVMVFAQSQIKPGQSAAPKPAFDPTEGMSTTEKVLAGIGKGFVDIGRGVGQAVGLVSRKDIEEARKLDAPLMNTTAGKVGNFVGNVAAMAPTAVIPGANTLVGASAIGAASGFLQPSTSTNETLTNTALGSVIGPAANVAGRVIGAGYQGAKALAEPFYAAGQNKIAARTMQRFAESPQAAAQAASVAQSAVPGVQPTAAEATKDIGLAQLQRSLQSTDPTGFGNELSRRLMSNNAARVNALKQIAGDDAAMSAAVGARDDAANALYGKAFASDAMRREVAQNEAAQQAALDYARRGGMGTLPTSAQSATEGIRPSATLQDLSKRSAFKSAIEDAKRLAANKGESIGDPLTSLRGLHYIKLALDDALEPTATNALGRNAKGGLSDMKDLLVGEIEKISPAYGAAKQVYQQMSEPINQMQVGQRLLQKYSSATNDLAGNPKLRAEAFNRALQDEESLLRNATGFKGRNALNDVMTPDQARTIRAVADELGLQSAVENAGKATGSNTAQNLASQNVLRQLIGPTGLPQSWAENALLTTIMRPVQFAAQAGEPRVTNRLAQALLNPQDAAELLQMANTPGLAQRFGRRALPWTAPVTLGVQRSEALRE